MSGIRRATGLRYICSVKRILNKPTKMKHTGLAVVLTTALMLPLGWWLSGKSAFKTFAATTNSLKPLTSADSIRINNDTTLRHLEAALDSIAADSGMAGATWSFRLVTVDSGKVLCDRHGAQSMVPASVMKIVTTGTALKLLGPNYHFTTSLQYDGSIDGGTLNGNIYIRGTGDPTLASETFGSSIDKVLAAWSEAIKKQGIDSIAGKIIGDAEAWERDPIPGGWAWEDMQSDYGIGPCGLSFHENGFDLKLSPAGGGVSMHVDPQVPGMKLYNSAVKNATVAKSYAYVAGAPYQFERVVLGEIGASLEARSAIPDPPLFAAQKLTETLKHKGVGVRDSSITQRLLRLGGVKADTTGPNKKTRTTFYTQSSPALREIVYHTNQVSHNFYAESVLRAIAYGTKGYGSTAGGAATVTGYWKGKGVDLRGFCMADGSGVSRFDAVSSTQLTDMLRQYAQDSSVFNVFYRSLPIAGETGTLRKIAQGTDAQGNVRAKSGTMSRVKCYTGYVRTKRGKFLAFSMMANNFSFENTMMRDKFENLMVKMAQLQ